MIKQRVITILLSLCVVVLYAHGGRTDKYGGHNNRKTGGYHYHNAGSFHHPSNPYQNHKTCGICNVKPNKSSSSTYSKQWYKGGTLHNATVSEWNNSTYKNKLATAADWLASTNWKGHLKTSNDFKRLKIQAQRLVNGVDEIVYGLDELDHSKVNKFAAALITLSNDLNP